MALEKLYSLIAGGLQLTVGWYNDLVMPISNMQNVTPLSSLSAIITGMTFSYVSASEAISLFSKFSSSDASSGNIPSWFKIDKRVWTEERVSPDRC